MTKLLQGNIAINLTALLHNILIALKYFLNNALQVRAFSADAQHRRRPFTGFLAKKGATPRTPIDDAEIFKKDKRNCPTYAPKTFALTIKSSIMPLAHGSVGHLQEAD